MKPDFTLKRYAELCAALADCGYTSLTISAYMQAEILPEKVVLLRHDVDSRPSHALKLAQIEIEHGLLATYYFRTVRGAYDPATIRSIHQMGHEAGYHYETLAQTRGDLPAALKLFEAELAKLRQHAPITSASMHGSPLKPWDNRAIWEAATPQDFGLIGEAYRDLDYSRLIYLNDTGRTWHPTRYNLRDNAETPPPYQPESSADLIALLKGSEARHWCISAHPERWQALGGRWAYQLARDVGGNMIKSGLKMLR